MANKRRLIDSAELTSVLPVVEEDKQISLFGAVADVVIMISKCTPVDAVEVVRCADCCRNSNGICRIMQLEMKPDDFCSYGKREEQNNGQD